jgi:hypothetical protein
MIALNTQASSQSKTPHIINNHVTANIAAEATGYNIQYLRRLLRSGRLKGIKIGQVWLIEILSLETYLQHVENTSDRRCGS